MKITRKQLKALILEVSSRNPSILLEYPESYGYEDKSAEGELGTAMGETATEKAKKSLYHMGAQSQQLHDMLSDDQAMPPEIEKAIIQAGELVEKAFKSVMYNKNSASGG
tara:strand:- start:1291 stop:1620 length:330 start_codon:yes stop_codon:yes gene_type:complete